MLLAIGTSVADAARHTGVSERTIWRRLADPAFHQQVETERAELLTRTSAQLSACGPLAVTTLRDLLKSERDQVRLGAARSILELGVDLRELVALEARVAALEQGGFRR